MRILLQAVLLVILVTLRPVLAPPGPVPAPALALDPQKVQGFTVSWEGKKATYRRHGEAFRLDEPGVPLPVATPDPGAPDYDGLSSAVPAEERRRMRMDRLSQNLLASLTGARLVDLKDGTFDENPLGIIEIQPGPMTLEVGAQSPSGTGHYARAMPEGRILVVPLTTISTLKQLARAEFPAPSF